MAFILVKDSGYVQTLPGGNFQFSDSVFQPVSTLTDEQRKEFGVFELVETIQPDFDIAIQSVSEGAPTFANGSWLQSWIVSKLTPGEIEEKASVASKVARTQRGQLLQASDWTALTDCPLSDDGKAAWHTYRQQLRDISKQDGFPFNVAWPDVPKS